MALVSCRPRGDEYLYPSNNIAYNEQLREEVRDGNKSIGGVYGCNDAVSRCIDHWKPLVGVLEISLRSAILPEMSSLVLLGAPNVLSVHSSLTVIE